MFNCCEGVSPTMLGREEEPIRACMPIDLNLRAGPFDAVIGTKDKWPNGKTLQVYFYTNNVSSALIAKCLAKMQEWSQYANIYFAQTTNIHSSDLRVAFEKGGSWSYLGNQANMKKGEPTMNFGWLTDATDADEVSRVVLHETGHALGLMHEHQHPTGKIPWNRDAVIAYYQKQGWTAKQTQEQVLDRIEGDTQYSQYDKNSIMEYPIPRELVTDPSYSVGFNRQLSPTDKSFIATIYPGAKGPVVAPRPSPSRDPRKGRRGRHGRRDKRRHGRRGRSRESSESSSSRGSRAGSASRSSDDDYDDDDGSDSDDFDDDGDDFD